MAVMVKVDLCIKYNNQRFTYIKICFQGKMFITSIFYIFLL